MKKPVPSDMRKPFFVLDENARGMREIAMPLNPHAMPGSATPSKGGVPCDHQLGDRAFLLGAT